jgi:hypothetical protein
MPYVISRYPTSRLGTLFHLLAAPFVSVWDALCIAATEVRTDFADLYRYDFLPAVRYVLTGDAKLPVKQAAAQAVASASVAALTARDNVKRGFSYALDRAGDFFIRHIGIRAIALFALVFLPLIFGVRLIVDALKSETVSEFADAAKFFGSLTLRGLD